MLRIDKNPAQLFPPDKAEQLARDLTEGDEDGWTYKAIHDPTGRGLSYIEIQDENGEHIAKF